MVVGSIVSYGFIGQPRLIINKDFYITFTNYYKHGTMLLKSNETTFLYKNLRLLVHGMAESKVSKKSFEFSSKN